MVHCVVTPLSKRQSVQFNVLRVLHGVTRSHRFTRCK